MSFGRTGFAFIVGSLPVLCLLLRAAPAHACSVCGSDDPLVAVGDASPEAGAVRFALSLSAVTASARSDDEPTETEAVSRTTLVPTVVYSPVSRLNLVGSLPLLRNRFRVTGPDDHLAATLWGVGDAELSARYFVWSQLNFGADRRQDLAVSAGASIPTGRNDATLDGERLDEHAQLGRGALGPYLSVLYAFHQDPWNFSVDATARTFTTNHYDYRYGSAVLWNAAVQLRILERVALDAGINGRYAARDRQSGELQQNTGGFVVQAVPGVSLRVADHLQLHARVELPFVKDLFGVQTLGPTYLALAQWAP